MDWLRNRRIILTQKKVSYILDIPAPDTIREDVFEKKKATYKMWKDDNVIVKYIMFVLMNNELQRQYEDMDVPSILLNL